MACWNGCRNQEKSNFAILTSERSESDCPFLSYVDFGPTLALPVHCVTDEKSDILEHWSAKPSG